MTAVLYAVFAIEREAAAVSQLFPGLQLYLKAFLAAKKEHVVEIYLSIAGGAWSNFSDNSLDLPKLIEEALVEPPKTSSQTALSAALSTILCRHNSRHSGQPASILICEDSHCGCIEHISFMNTVFEAQRQGIKIDVISSSSGSGIGDELLDSVNDEVLLRQAASITGGYYLELNAKDADSNESLLPLLFSLSMGTRMHPSTTGLLNLPSQGGADFRGACFCHGRIIDMGFVCSVCLSGKVMNGGMAASLLTSFV